MAGTARKSQGIWGAIRALVGGFGSVSEHNQSLTDLESLRVAMLAGVIGTPDLRIGTSAASALKNDAYSLYVGAIRAEQAAGETAFTATTHDIADPDADPREAIFLLSIDNAGAHTITKGADAAADAAVAPSVPAGEEEVGQVLIQHDGTAIFDASTDLLSASHLTVTYTDTIGAMVAADLVAATINA